MEEQEPQGEKRRPPGTTEELELEQQDEQESEEREGQQKRKADHMDPEDETMEPMWMDELMLVQTGLPFIVEITGKILMDDAVYKDMQRELDMIKGIQML